MSQSVQLHRRRDFTELLNATFWYVRYHYRPLFIALACSVGPLKLLQTAAVKVYLKHVNYVNHSWLRTNAGEPVTPWSVLSKSLSPSLFIAFFFLVFINLVIVLIVNSHILEYEEHPGESVRVKQIWERVEVDLFTGTGLWFLLVLLLAGAFLLLVIPGVYLLVPCSIALFVHMREGTPVLKTVKRSLDLCRGQWWTGFGFLLILVLLQFAATFGSGLLLSFIWRATGLPFDNWVRGPLQVIVVIADSVTTAVTFIGFAFLYYSFLEHKEGIGLLNEVETIGQVPISNRFSTNDESTLN